jgi:hypothetical protein
MNQDFGLSLTPANARRLVRFQKIFKLELSDAIISLAKQDRINQDDFDQFVCPHSEVKETVTQFLLDCNLRGIIQQDYHPEFSETELLNVIKIKKPKHITIFTNRQGIWQKAAKSLLLGKNIHYCPPYFYTSSEDIDKLRDGVLIVDLIKSEFSYMNKLRDFSSEFPQTILFSAKKETTDDLIAWTVLAKALFPTMPHPLYPKLVKNIPEEWKELPLSLFATFYNVCLFPEYVIESSIIDLMSDDNSFFHKETI